MGIGMRFRLIIFCSGFLAVMACTECDRENQRECEVSEPSAGLAWLEQERAGIESMDADLRSYFYIASGRYKNQKVFVLSDCCPHCNTISEVKDCSGNLLGLLQADIPSDEISEFNVIYGGEKCSF